MSSRTQVDGKCASIHRPNIIIFYTDDQGFGDRQKYHDWLLDMPNFEEVAANGMDFSDGHTASGVCSPSRFALLTGEYWFRHNPARDVVVSNAHPYVMDAKTTLPKVLKSVGYKTYMSGKWHLGMKFDEDNFDAGIYGGPIDGGFDSYFGIPASMDFGNVAFIRDKLFETPPTFWSQRHGNELWSCRHNVSACNTWNLRGYMKQKAPGFAKRISPTWDPRYCAPNITAEAIHFMDIHMKTHGEDVPFFLYTALSSPHKPHVPHPDWEGHNKLKFGNYADFLEQTDYHLGQILANMGKWDITDNTLLIISSDNGPEDKQLFQKSGGLLSAWIYRNGKRSLFEGGHRVPFLMQWPKIIPAGAMNDHTVNQVDLVATLAEMTGATLKKGDAYDSHSFWRAVCDPAGATPKQVRAGQPMVFEVPKSVSGAGPGIGIRCRNKKVLYAENQWWMFDLKSDPREKTNIMHEQKKEFDSLKDLLFEIIRKGFSPATAVCH
ncbi:Arylsulfatase [Hondaea fermentalgiana]|uniref:Arylsulfatase n=1 Tax=Hondaea fermentalgiana TaxID=2315210 RepID=A0A2R5GKD7_9STRA|nr:Arylsulfatase [Hondaea fermentalgiana]|eukprot:GBG31085.1 Arylsulfatase [Hondaea fermentalgiana]